MSLSTNLSNFSFTQTDGNSAVPVTRSLTSSFAGAAGIFQTGQLISTADVTIGLPVTPCYQVYIKNLHATAKLTVTAVPSGGTSAILQILGACSFMAIWNPSAAATSGGITSLRLQSDSTSTPVEYFLGG